MSGGNSTRDGPLRRQATAGYQDQDARHAEVAVLRSLDDRAQLNAIATGDVGEGLARRQSVKDSVSERQREPGPRGEHAVNECDLVVPAHIRRRDAGAEGDALDGVTLAHDVCRNDRRPPSGRRRAPRHHQVLVRTRGAEGNRDADTSGDDALPRRSDHGFRPPGTRMTPAVPPADAKYMSASRSTRGSTS